MTVARCCRLSIYNYIYIYIPFLVLAQPCKALPGAVCVKDLFTLEIVLLMFKIFSLWKGFDPILEHQMMAGGF